MNLEYGAANDRLSCVAELVKSFDSGFWKVLTTATKLAA